MIKLTWNVRSVIANIQLLFNSDNVFQARFSFELLCTLVPGEFPDIKIKDHINQGFDVISSRRD